jgi:hypothetical protein
VGSLRSLHTSAHIDRKERKVSFICEGQWLLIEWFETAGDINYIGDISYPGESVVRDQGTAFLLRLYECNSFGSVSQRYASPHNNRNNYSHRVAKQYMEIWYRELKSGTPWDEAIYFPLNWNNSFVRDNHWTNEFILSNLLGRK